MYRYYMVNSGSVPWCHAVCPTQESAQNALHAFNRSWPTVLANRPLMDYSRLMMQAAGDHLPA